jgi:hypothetical protein
MKIETHQQQLTNKKGFNLLARKKLCGIFMYDYVLAC